MKCTRDWMKAELLAEAEVVVDKLLDWHDNTPALSEWSFSPLDEQLKFWEKHWSEGVAKQTIWLSGIVDFEKTEEILQEIGQMAISDRSVWRRAQEWGERFGAMEAAERARANALPGKWGAPFRC